jgi:hypothetical protein
MICTSICDYSVHETRHMFAVNAGAVQWLLDIAAEQEQKEMLLAYCFLWNGHQAPQPVEKDYAKTVVDSAIETFLRGDIQADQVARGSSQVCSNSTSAGFFCLWTILFSRRL